MKLVIREEAVDDLDQIHDWIAKDNLSAANRVVRALRQRMNSVLLPELEHFPPDAGHSPYPAWRK